MELDTSKSAVFQKGNDTIVNHHLNGRNYVLRLTDYPKRVHILLFEKLDNMNCFRGEHIVNDDWVGDVPELITQVLTRK
jgi:hypothetical protein